MEKTNLDKKAEQNIIDAQIKDALLQENNFKGQIQDEQAEPIRRDIVLYDSLLEAEKKYLVLALENKIMGIDTQRQSYLASLGGWILSQLHYSYIAHPPNNYFEALKIVEENIPALVNLNKYCMTSLDNLCLKELEKEQEADFTQFPVVSVAKALIAYTIKNIPMLSKDLIKRLKEIYRNPVPADLQILKRILPFVPKNREIFKKIRAIAIKSLSAAKDGKRKEEVLKTWRYCVISGESDLNIKISIFRDLIEQDCEFVPISFFDY
jgi:hypothetical protein